MEPRTSNGSAMERLALFLRRLPGVGPKTAARLAHALYRMSETDARGIAQAIVDMREKTRLCPACGQITEDVPCRICGDPARDSSVLCVVEEPANAQAVERTRAFRGRYHVLHGALSPLDGIGPDQLAIESLIGRLRTGRSRKSSCDQPERQGRSDCSLPVQAHPAAQYPREPHRNRRPAGRRPGIRRRGDARPFPSGTPAAGRADPIARGGNRLTSPRVIP